MRFVLALLRALLAILLAPLRLLGFGGQGFHRRRSGRRVA